MHNVKRAVLVLLVAVTASACVPWRVAGPCDPYPWQPQASTGR